MTPLPSYGNGFLYSIFNLLLEQSRNFSISVIEIFSPKSGSLVLFYSLYISDETPYTFIY